jgi:hypothetical protein
VTVDPTLERLLGRSPGSMRALIAEKTSQVEATHS